MKIALIGYCSPFDLVDLIPLEKLIRDVNLRQIFRGIPVSDAALTLVSMGHEVTVVTISEVVTETIVIDGENGFRFIVVPRIQRARIRALTFHKKEINVLRNLLDSLEVDVVHAHWTYEFAISAAMSRHPSVVTVHDAPLTILWHNRNLYFFFRWLLSIKFFIQYSRDCSMTFVSPYILNQLKRETFGWVDGKVIPNINPFFNQVNFSRVPSFDHKDLTNTISVGDSSRRKNMRNLIKAWKKVNKVLPDSKLNLVGPGLELGGDLQLWAADRDLDSGIVWHGVLSRNELAHLYEKSFLLIHPSREESFGLTFLEGMSFGLRIITHRKLKFINFVIGNSVGEVIDCEKPTVLANRITSNLLDLNKGINWKDYETELTRFEPVKVFNKYLQVYESAIKNHSLN